MATREIVQKVTNAVEYSDGTIRIDNVRASFPHLDKPYAKADKDGKMPEPKFGIVAMLDKKTHVAAKDLILKVIADMERREDTKVAKDKKFLRNGDDSDKVEYEGYWTVSARETKRPSVRNRQAEPMSEKEIADTIYAGCRVSVLIRPWFQDNDFGKRINAGLVAVQFVRDDAQIGEGRIDDEGVFEAVDESSDGFDESDGL